MTQLQAYFASVPDPQKHDTNRALAALMVSTIEMHFRGIKG
jgi:hypothetical protein